MIGTVNEKGRALSEISISNQVDGSYTRATAWIDTAFDGHLVFPLRLIEQLKLASLAEAEAILADGTKVTMETYLCFIDWFGARFPLQVVANDGRFPLLGVSLLAPNVLHIDYMTKQLRLE